MIRFVATSALALVVFTVACGGDGGGGTDMSSSNKDMSTSGTPDMTVVPPTFDVPAGCNTATVTLATVYPIISANCALSGCHVAGSTSPQMSPDMNTFKTNVVGVSSGRSPSSLKYIAQNNDLNNSFLLYKITGQQAKAQFGGDQMPYMKAALSATDQCTIINWVRSGAN